MTPLGGNTVFVRRELMEQMGGWDETCLTEDADLGIRLSISHARIRIIYDDEFVTREETPHTIEQFIKQRTRWNQGFIQILFQGRMVETGEALTAFAGLLCADFTRGAGILRPDGTSIAVIMFFFVKLPLWLAMLTFLPLYCFILAVFIDLAGLHEFLKAHNRKWSWREARHDALAFFPTNVLLGFGAMRAVFRYVQGSTNWEKTAHIGQHRGKAAA